MNYVNADLHEQETFGAVKGQLAVILNGPPGCGKDTLAKALSEVQPEFKVTEFKEALYLKTADYYGHDLVEFTEAATDRVLKEELYYCPTKDLYFPVTPREMLIQVSEVVIKPKYGDDYFGLAAGKTALSRGPFAVFSDGGFDQEVDALLEYFNHVLVIQLHRDGYTFEGDSRNYIGSDYSVVLKDNEERKGLSDIIGEIDEYVRTIST